ncbi:MAG TPA: LysM peptidoglycan-binding domain-containing protein [Chthoniobacterales bacterium]|nr:LysM peptidoglycan-binding domain-containing protein [Chthoniobacterales bacterium]
MKSLSFSVAALLLSALVSSHLCAQTLTRTPAPPSTAAQIEALIKKIDEQNAKIDALSQQILKLEQQIASTRPGVMIGESTPTPTASAPVATSPSSANAGNTHTVARGETLTSIAKMHGVSVSELQKFNHIENDRKLQIGQTIMIPTASSPSTSSSPGE